MPLEKLPISSIKPYPNNPRKNQKAIAKVANSIALFGLNQPIVVDKNYTIIAGHTRFAAVKKLGFSEVWVHIAANLSEAQADAYRLADNRTAEDSTWDERLLKLEFEKLERQYNELDTQKATGFDIGEIAETKAFDSGPPPDDSEHVPDDFLEPPVARTGDLWLLGEHRLMCGDATKQRDMLQLTANRKADLIFTDPPYNIEYTGSMGGKRPMMANDGLPDEEFFYFLKSVFDNCINSLQSYGSIYVCHASSMQMIFQHAMEESGFRIRNQIIWAKSHFSLTNSRYKPQHEPIFYGYIKNQTDRWYGRSGESSLWQIKKNMVNPLHPTMKPLELVLRAIHNSSRIGDVVLDCFGGSGSTLIACETCERQALLMEIAPRYVDTIIRRWQAQTKQQARLATNSCVFDEVQEARNSRSLITIPKSYPLLCVTNPNSPPQCANT
jgi:DNA modification methylase